MNVIIRKEEQHYYGNSPKFIEYPLECIDKRKTKIKKIHKMFFEKAGEKIENTQVINKNGRKAQLKFYIITKDEKNRDETDDEEVLYHLVNVKKEYEKMKEDLGERLFRWTMDVQKDKKEELVKRAQE